MTERPRILVVDDEPRGLELLVRTLRDVGEVRTAASGDAAWHQEQGQPPDLVVSDQRMPGMSGVDLLARIAEGDETAGRILLTGYADVDATIDAINRGRVHAYVSKPWSPDQLRATVAGVLQRVVLQRQNRCLLEDLSTRNRELETALESLREAQRRVVDAERLSAIGRMAAMVVHDFRGPLTVVRSASGELLRDPSLPRAEVHELAEALHEESERMSRMCTELLEVTRSSESAPARKVEELDEVLEDVLVVVARAIRQGDVTLRSELRSGAQLPLDVDRLRRAVLNLAFNALDALGGRGTLCLLSSATEREAVISVVDDGPGIPAEIRQRLFEPFVTCGKRGGSGLGLAIAKKILEDHDGWIDVEVPDGGGTTFHLHLPLDGKTPEPGGSLADPG